VIGTMSGNRVLTLFLEILYDFLVLRSSAIENWFNQRKRVSRYLILRGRLCEAILEGDEEVAVLLTRRCTRVVTGWMNARLVTRKLQKARIIRSMSDPNDGPS